MKGEAILAACDADLDLAQLIVTADGLCKHSKNLYDQCAQSAWIFHKSCDPAPSLRLEPHRALEQLARKGWCLDWRRVDEGSAGARARRSR